MHTLIKNIKQLVQIREGLEGPIRGKDMKELPMIENAWLAIEEGVIADYGSMSEFPGIGDWSNLKVIDAEGKIVMPSWCDSHTHLVFAGTREKEFVDRINGLSYEEIAKRGGGILNSAATLRNMSEDELYEKASIRLKEVMSLGTGCIEMKSGYGLNLASEMKILRVIRRLQDNFPLPIKSTFLGAHAVPTDFKGRKSDYVDHVIYDMIPAISEAGLADFIDVFCETNYFSPEDTLRICEAGREYGLAPKIHVNQFTSIGGIEASIKGGALTVDHLEVMTDSDIQCLRDSSVMPVILPSCSFFLNIPYGPAKKLMEAGLPLTIASDFNPGSTPSGNMNFVVALACIKCRMNPEEAINAATINGAFAMGSADICGSITRGKKANLIITSEIENYAQIPYSFGSNLVEAVLIDGKLN